MESVTISKAKLTVKLKENREQHKKEYEEALEGWQVEVVDALKEALKKAKKGEEFKTTFYLPEPQDYTNNYDIIIDQVEWNEEDQIELTLHEFNQYIRDDWSWKDQCTTTNALYTTKVRGK